MAEEAQAPAQDNAITLMPRDIVGIIQRHLLELNAYCSQNADVVDPMVIHANLERTWQIASRLPQIAKDASAPANGGGKQTEKRAN